MHELGVVCCTCFCTFYTSEMSTHSYMPFLFSINCLCHLLLYSVLECTDNIEVVQPLEPGFRRVCVTRDKEHV